MVIRDLLTHAAVAAFAVGLTMGVTTSASAQAKFGYTGAFEDAVDGFVGAIPTSSPPIMVGSDGESHFDPFGAGYDTSDGIQLNDSWAPDPAYADAFAPGFWTQLPGTFTWVLPACNSSGCENGRIVEPVAKWDFLGGSGWNPGTTGLKLFDSDGKISDIITVANDGVRGAATITFASVEVPEPGAWALMLIGFGGVGAALRSRRRMAIA
jgi:hypothetical protein